MSKIYSYIKSLGIDINELNAAINSMDAAMNIIENKIKPKYDKKAKFALELLGDHAVTQFYDSYSPHVYTNRKEDLFNAYKFSINSDGSYSLNDKAEYMHGGHRASNEVIYTNSFIFGYHGGATESKKGDHPNPGEPWWRAPVGEWTYWLSPAVQGPSPKDIIDSEFSGVIEPIEQQLAEEVYNFGTPYQVRCLNVLSKWVVYDN